MIKFVWQTVLTAIRVKYSSRKGRRERRARKQRVARVIGTKKEWKKKCQWKWKQIGILVVAPRRREEKSSSRGGVRMMIASAILLRLEIEWRDFYSVFHVSLAWKLLIYCKILIPKLKYLKTEEDILKWNQRNCKISFVEWNIHAWWRHDGSRWNEAHRFAGNKGNTEPTPRAQVRQSFSKCGQTPSQRTDQIPAAAVI